jgi:ribonuclease BN (tRNA processing enzyme)
MRLTILGSGTYQPELKRHCASHLIQIGRQNLVFDFGRGCLNQLLMLGINYYDIDAIFISHTHPDHFSELASFLHIALFEPGQARLRRKPITIYGPRGIIKAVNHLSLAMGLKSAQPKYPVITKEMTSGKIIKGKGWKITVYPTFHVKDINSLAWRLIIGRKIFAYSGDSGDSLGLRQAIKNADLGLIEASWPKELEPKMHLTAEQAGKICQESGVKKLVLTHVSPYYRQNFDIRKEAKKYFKGPVLLAKDLMKIKI